MKNSNNRNRRFLPADLYPRRITGYNQRNMRNLGDAPKQDVYNRTGVERDIYEDLPIDLQPRPIEERTGVTVGTGGFGTPNNLNDYLLGKISNDMNILSSTATLDRGLIGRSITVGTDPVLIVKSQFLRGYIIMNPSLVVGGTAVGTLLASASRTVDGNTQATSLGVANYRDLHMFVDITTVTGATPTLDIYAQAQDPISGNWADTQLLFSALSSSGTFYVNPGSLGLSTEFAIRWVLGGTTPDFTFSIGYVLKEGLPGTGAGVGKTIYLGSSGVTTNAGFPLLEGQSRTFYIKENTELWAVANASLDLRVFEL